MSNKRLIKNIINRILQTKNIIKEITEKDDDNLDVQLKAYNYDLKSLEEILDDLLDE
jgi:hypothetical protein